MPKIYRHKKSKKSKAKKIMNSFLNEDGTRKQTSIEKFVEDLLISLRIPYQPEYKFKGKYFDFMCIGKQPNFKFAIEVHGSYWHCYNYMVEGNQSKKDLTKLQKRNLRNDKRKEDLLQDAGIPLLVIWETDIKTKPSKVKESLVNYYEGKIN